MTCTTATTKQTTLTNCYDLPSDAKIASRRRSGRGGFFLLSVLTFLMSRSEAFASNQGSYGSSMFGMRLNHQRFRGGSQDAKVGRNEERNKPPLTCVMQAPTGAVGTGNNGEEEINGRKKRSSAVKVQHTPVEYVAETKLPTDIGQFQLRAYRVPGAPIGQEPCVIYYREKPPFGGGNSDTGTDAVPVRIHDQCLTSEVFRSQRCDCKEQLNMALKYIKKHGGFIIYLQQEGRGIGLANKVAAYSLQDVGLDTVDANLHLGFPEDAREYTVVPSILKDMQVRSIQLMTNNPRKTNILTELGVDVERTLPMVVPQTNQYNHKYMETKVERMNHANLAKLISKDPRAAPSAAEKMAVANGMMAPRKTTQKKENNEETPLAPASSLADQYINNGTEMSANAVQVSLELVDDDEEAIDEQLGITAREDGYCLGKQSVLDAIAAVKRGEMIVVVDDLDRENEGDFIMAAEKCTDLDMAQIIRYSSGVICVGMEGKRLDELKMPAMVSNNEDPKGTAFTVSVDATKEHGITTGISANDRAVTMRLLADPSTTAKDFHRPGHIFPLRAVDGGVLERGGHTEAAVDIAKLAGLSPAGVLCEIVSEENPTEMMRLPEIKRFCARHGYVLTSIADLSQYRREIEGRKN